MPGRAIIIGAGGFGRETFNWFRDWSGEQAMLGRRWQFAGFLADPQPDRATIASLGAEYLGPVSRLGELSNVVYYIGVGDPDAREALDKQALDMGATAGPAIVHPSSVIGSNVSVGDGSVICPGVVLTTNITAGRHVHLNLRATVGHDAVLEDYVTVSPGAAISGNVTLSRGVMVGTNAAINEKLHVGAGAKIGSGAAVVKDVAAGVVAVGVPARPRT
jgi:sugar O-acyltransferase (sialic acid O-acetyltransferase NeuD family)